MSRSYSISLAPTYDEENTDHEIVSLRAKLQQVHDVSTKVALSTALRHRFFRSGQLEDLQESLNLLEDTPRLTIDNIGTASLTLHPEILPSEENWVRWQPWIEAQGYSLPARLHPGWVPSWTDPSRPGRMLLSPDAFGSQNSYITDASRTRDGKRVFFKLYAQGEGQELEIAAYFSSQPQRSDLRNHCCPLLDVLRPPLLHGRPYYILVFPLLRPLFDPDPDTVEDILISIIALAEGIAFIHEHNVAHRDVHYRNFMMDATHLMPEGWHPWMTYVANSPGEVAREPVVLPRSQVPMKYFVTDLGMSVQYRSYDDRGLVTGIGGLNRTLPEQSATVPYDPFPADVRMFGDMLRDWQYGFLGLGFLDPLIAKLCHDDPLLRLPASQMVTELRSLAAQRSRFSLQLPLRRRDSPGVSLKVWLRYITRVLSVKQASNTWTGATFL